MGLLDDDLLDQAPSEPVEISLPKSQDGELWPKIGHAHIFYCGYVCVMLAFFVCFLFSFFSFFIRVTLSALL